MLLMSALCVKRRNYVWVSVPIMPCDKINSAIIVFSLILSLNLVDVVYVPKHC